MKMKTLHFDQILYTILLKILNKIFSSLFIGLLLCCKKFLEIRKLTRFPRKIEEILKNRGKSFFWIVFVFFLVKYYNLAKSYLIILTSK